MRWERQYAVDVLGFFKGLPMEVGLAQIADHAVAVSSRVAGGRSIPDERQPCPVITFPRLGIRLTPQRARARRVGNFSRYKAIWNVEIQWMVAFRWMALLGMVLFCVPTCPLVGADLPENPKALLGKGIGRGATTFLKVARGSMGLGEFGGWYRRCLAELARQEWTEALPCQVPCALPGPAIPHWGYPLAGVRSPSGRTSRGARNWVEEVRRIDTLNHGNGAWAATWTTQDGDCR